MKVKYNKLRLIIAFGLIGAGIFLIISSILIS